MPKKFIVYNCCKNSNMKKVEKNSNDNIYQCSKCGKRFIPYSDLVGIIE